MHKLLAVLLLTASAFAQNSSPAQDALDALFADQYPVLEQHISADVLQKFTDYPAEARETWFGSLLMIGKKLHAGNVRRLNGTGKVLSADLPYAGTVLEVELMDSTVTGDTATVDFAFHVLAGDRETHSKSIPHRMILGMHREDGVWKIASLQETADIPLDDNTVLANLKEAIIARNESGAAAAIRDINLAEAAYASQHHGRFACSLDELRSQAPAQFQKVSFLPDGTLAGYSLAIRNCTPKTYQTTAAPKQKNVDSRRSFCSDESDIIYLSPGDADTCLKDKQPL